MKAFGADRPSFTVPVDLDIGEGHVVSCVEQLDLLRELDCLQTSHGECHAKGVCSASLALSESDAVAFLKRGEGVMRR